MSQFIEDNSILSDYQTGFRPGRGTESALIAIWDDLKNAVDHNGVAALLLLDLSAAFDTVDHNKDSTKTLQTLTSGDYIAHKPLVAD